MSTGYGAYDPDEPEGSSPRGSQYVSRRDVQWLLGITAVLVVALAPIYNHYRERSEKARCTLNMGAIANAMGLYREQWDSRFPPIAMLGDNDEPLLFPLGPDGRPANAYPEGKPYTWVSLLKEYMTRRADFRCPSSRREELVENHHHEGPVLSSYGLYVALSGLPLTSIDRPSETVAITETANHGALRTYNPVPFTDREGRVVPVDGFVVGFDTGNFDFEPDQGTKAVTRLAYRDTAEGDFDVAKRSRHPRGNHFLFADGHMRTLPATAARVRYLGPDELTGLWSARRQGGR